MSALDLRRLQRWFAHVMVHPDSAATALRGRAAAALVPPNDVAAGRVLAPNPHLSFAGMLQVYHGGYLARLVEVLQSDYGALLHTLGEAAFRDLAAAYLRVCPSRHPNLNQRGAGIGDSSSVPDHPGPSATRSASPSSWPAPPPNHAATLHSARFPGTSTERHLPAVSRAC